MRKNNFLIAVVFLILIAFFMVNGIPTVSAESDDITTLIQTANTPEDHMKIAEYYNKQAENMDQMAKMHVSMGEAYSKRSKPMKGMTNHCAKLSTDSKKSAEQYREMAQEHEQMANEMMDRDSH